MASKAIVVRFEGENVQPNGFFSFTAMCLYTDTTNPAKGIILGPIVFLDPAAPAGWTANIKQEMVNVGLQFGFSDLVTTSCLVPSYA